MFLKEIFMFARFLAIASIVLLASACSSTLPKAEIASHEDSSRNIPKIDHMIVDLKRSYISQCYSPILKKNPPDSAANFGIGSHHLAETGIDIAEKEVVRCQVYLVLAVVQVIAAL